MSTDNPTSTTRQRRDAARARRVAREQAAATADRRRHRLTILGGLVAAAAVIVVAAVLISSGGSTAKTAAAGGAVSGTQATQQLLGGIPQNGVTIGDPKAPVTLVEFADPQCPFCKDFTLQEMPAIVRKYVRTGKVQMQLRLLTFIGNDSTTAARALTAAGRQGKLWTAADLLYRNQGTENSGYVTDSFLRGVLRGAGADPAKALAAAGGAQVTAQLGEATTMASRYGVNSTPTILVGPTGGTLAKDTEQAPTAAGLGKLIDAVPAKGGA